MNFAVPKGEFINVSNQALGALDEILLDSDQRLRLLPYSEYQKIPYDHLRAWANSRSIYGFPTIELVEWLKDRINGRKALEIGAGNGNLGRYLGIPMTDSYQQVEDKQTVEYLTFYGIKPTTPPKDVEKEDGENAVRRRKPQVVVACYVTEKHDPRDPLSRGNYKGVRYDYIIDRCDTFILIGNEVIHGNNRALKIPNSRFYFPWLVSRAQRPDMNRIWVWDRSNWVGK